jgi:pimeloyl-ACP methyl ester carboxylesterase
MTPPIAQAVLLIAAVVSLAFAPAAGAMVKAAPPTPVIFVHGNSGSAQQFETNAMRLTSNGFPQRRIFAYEYNSLLPSNDLAVANLDGFIASVKRRTGADRVDVLAHSRGTTVMHTYLATPERAASVRRYVNFDGRTSEALPGGVRTLAVWGEGDQTRAIVGARNVYFPGKAHTEVTTSAEAFGEVFEFLRGRQPKTRAVVPERPSEVTVRGRALDFPSNVGIDAGTLRVYVLDGRTGQRARNRPVYRKELDASGRFGPIEVNGRRRYEFAVSQPGATTIHNYPEPFERDDLLYRVLSAPLLNPFIERSPDHVSLTVTRMREFWGDQASPNANDRLRINGVNVINAAIAPRVRRVLAVFNFDRNSDGVSDTSAPLAPFNSIGFLTGVDLFIPASPDAGGTIPVRETMRRPHAQTQTTRVPDWPSDRHSVSVYFKDYDAKAFRKRRTGK